MMKKIAAIVLIVITGGTWLYLDQLNKQEQLIAEQARQAMIQAREQAKARFNTQIKDDLNNCLATAEKNKADFLTLNQKPVPRKPGEFTITQAVADEAAKMLADATAACQLTFDTRSASGY
jgi:tRNA(Met) C34 N-acetyltransferase TmcA